MKLHYQNILLISHEMSATGAPHMLYYVAQILKDNGKNVIVVSPEDGIMRQKFTDIHIPVIVDKNLHHGHNEFKEFAKKFDVVIVNTIALQHIVRCLIDIQGLDIIWWLHEAQALTYTLNQCLSLARPNVRLFCVSKYAQSYIPKAFHSEVLYNGVVEPKIEHDILILPKSNKLTFALLGTIEPRKGQDLLCLAISYLPEEIRKNCRFIFAGNLFDSNQDFWSYCYNLIKDFPEVSYIGLLHPNQVPHLIKDIDVLISCSRDDSFSLVCVESAMQKKGIILNQYVGVSEVLSPSKSCLLFDIENIQSLVNQIIFAYQHQNEVKAMGERAYNTYLQYFTYEQFAHSFLNLLEKKEM